MKPESKNDHETFGRYFRVLIFLATKDSCRTALACYPIPLTELVLNFGDFAPEKFYSSSSFQMLLLSALLMEQDELTLVLRRIETGSLLELCIDWIREEWAMVPRGPVHAASFALMEYLTHGGNPSIRNLVVSWTSALEICIQALDSFCDAADRDELELDLLYFNLRFEARRIVADYRGNVRENLFDVIRQEFHELSNEHKKFLALYKRHLDVICCGFAHLPTYRIALAETYAQKEIARGAETDISAILRSPIKHPVSARITQLFFGNCMELFPLEFRTWKPKTPEAGDWKEINSSEDSCQIMDTQPTIDKVGDTEDEESISLDGTPLETEKRNDMKKTYAQVCNENAASADRTCEEGRHVQSYMEATFHFGRDPLDSVEASAPETSAIDKKIYMHSRPTNGTIALLRQVQYCNHKD